MVFKSRGFFSNHLSFFIYIIESGIQIYVDSEARFTFCGMIQTLYGASKEGQRMHESVDRTSSVAAKRRVSPMP